MKNPVSPNPNSLVGRHFHTIKTDTGEVELQGKVVAKIDPTHYLVQLYEWFAGTETCQKIYSVEQMTHGYPGSQQFQFYRDDEERASWWEAYGKYRMPKAAE
jgi:hypothetical protein